MLPKRKPQVLLPNYYTKVCNIGESAIYGLIMCHFFKKVDTEYQWLKGLFCNVLIPNYIISFDFWLLCTFNYRTYMSKYIQLKSSSYAHAQHRHFNMQPHNPFLCWQLFFLLNVSITFLNSCTWFFFMLVLITGTFGRKYHFQCKINVMAVSLNWIYRTRGFWNFNQK